MGRQVLVLNADFTAISVCTIPKAFLLVYLNKAEMVEEADSYFIRTISSIYASPSIIKLNKYVNVPYKSVLLNRTNIYKRDDHSCVYCGTQKDLTLDHVVPKSKGGKTSWENLVTACRKCNATKGHLTPEEAGMPLTKKPYRPSFVVFVSKYAAHKEDKWLPYLKQKSV
jgi:5-methylcytosine-specific restriction endonuclease McrA